MLPLFALETCHGTTLAVGAGTRRLLHISATHPNVTAPLLFAGDPLGTRVLPFALDLENGDVVFPYDAGPGAMLLLAAPAPGGTMTLRLPLEDRFLSAIPGGSVEGNRGSAGEWERFRAIPHEPPAGPAIDAAHRLMAEVCHWLASPPGWADLLAGLLAVPGSQGVALLAGAVWPLLTLDEFDRLVRRLPHEAGLSQQIAALFPQDFWAITALPDLLAWMRTRQEFAPSALPPFALAAVSAYDDGAVAPEAKPPHGFPLIVGPAADHLARDGFDGRFVSLGHACNGSLRQMAEPHRGTAIVATARSEGLYLLEWIAHHRRLGIEAFFLYSNNNDDESDALLAALHMAGVITWVQNELSPGTSAQNKAYGHALGVLGPLLEYRWALFIDLDEFLVLEPDRYAGIGAFARRHEMRRTEAIGINWVTVGSGGQKHWDNAPLTRRNTDLLGAPNPHIKVMMAPRHFIHAHPHFPFADARRSFVFRLADGTLHAHRNQPRDAYHAQAFADDPSEVDACLYHYLYKSLDEFIWKSSRNRGDFPMSQGINFNALDRNAAASFLEQHRCSTIRRNDRLARSARGLEEELGRLRAIPGIDAAEQLTIASFQTRLAAVIAELLDGLHLQSLGEPGEELRTLLLEAAPS